MSKRSKLKINQAKFLGRQTCNLFYGQNWQAGGGEEVKITAIGDYDENHEGHINQGDTDVKDEDDDTLVQPDRLASALVVTCVQSGEQK